MKGDIEVLSQLLNSMSDAVEKMDELKNSNKVQDFNKIKTFVLDLQEKINEEIQRFKVE